MVTYADVDTSTRLAIDWPRVAAVVPDAAIGAVLVSWATWLTWGTGGREPYRLSIHALVIAIAVVSVRPWRVLPPTVMALGTGLGAAAFLVTATAPTGWAGADDAASYAIAGQTFLVVAAWARDDGRRMAVLGAVIGAAGLEFAQGWLAWWGSATPTVPFQGTFFWHNQAGIFLAAGAVTSWATIAYGARPLSTLAWVAGPLAGAGVLFSTSRGSQMGLGVSAAVLAGACLLGSDTLRRLARLGGVLLATGAVSVVLTGPPFFAHRTSPTAATAVRGAHEDLSGNGHQRLEDWRRAWEVFKHWPLSGAGFHSYSSASGLVTDNRDHVQTAFAHNGFLQSLSDGGLLLSLPFWGACVLLAVVAARRLPAAARRRDAAQVGGAVLLLLLLCHSGMDFDWSYPALLILAAVAAVLAVGVLRPRSTVTSRRTGTIWCTILLLGLLVSAVGAWHGGLNLNVAVEAL